MASKYVAGLIQCNHGAVRAIAVVFPDHIEHRDMATRVFKDMDFVVSAGQCQVYESRTSVEVEAGGESIGLGLKSRPLADEFLIKEAMGLVHRDRGDDIPDGARPGDIVKELTARNPSFNIDNIR